MPDRMLVPSSGRPSPDAPAREPADLRAAALEILTGAELAHIVDLVAYCDDGPDGDGIVVANSEGAVRLSRRDPDVPAVVLWGRDPVGCQDPLAFTPYDVEVADPTPPNARHSYPWAGRRLASAFADPRAPDVIVVHTAAHYWPERGGTLGEHGSLNAVQSRAPLVLSGAGVRSRGVLPCAARTVDVGATLAWLAGVPVADLADMDGAPLAELTEPAAPDVPAARFVVGLLWDGANCNDLLHLAQTGRLPAVARLLERGCALQGGAIAEFPSVTLVNHTCALTGVGPGRHGIVHNAFYDRSVGTRAVPNESAGWHQAMDWLRPGVMTVFERVEMARPGVVTACVNDPVDRGATYSTFARIRAATLAGDAPEGARSLRSLLPDPRGDARASQDWVATDADYSWSSQVDASGLDQVLELWSDAASAPALLWWNTTVTDTGHHIGGPRSAASRASLADADRRLGVFLDHLDSLGVADDTVVLLTADHGSEPADPTCRGDWDDALRAAGIPFRDEAYGFLYLG